MSDLRLRTISTESTTVNSPYGERDPGAIGIGRNSAGVEERSSRHGAGVAVGSDPMHRDLGGGGGGGARTSWMIKLVAKRELGLTSKEVEVNDATTLPMLMASIKALLPVETEFTVTANKSEISEATMMSLRSVTQLIVQGTASIAPGVEATTLAAVTAREEPVREVPVHEQAGLQAAVLVREAPPAESNLRAPPLPTRAPAQPTHALTFVGRPEGLVPLPYSDDPTVLLRAVEESPASDATTSTLAEEVAAAASERSRLESESRARDAERDRLAGEAALEAEQQTLRIASNPYLVLSVGSNEWRHYCNPDTVTVEKIVEFVVERDASFRGAAIKLQVENQILTNENRRQLLRNRTVVMLPTTPAGGEHCE